MIWGIIAGAVVFWVGYAAGYFIATWIVRNFLP